MDFGSRTCVLPECHSVPRSKFALSDSSQKKSKRQQIDNPVYRNVGTWNHTQSLSELARLLSTFLRPEVGHDRALLGRIFYRNWNQHRSAVYFRRLAELRRGLRILEQAGVRELVEQLNAAFYNQGVSKNARKISEWQALPCQHFMTAAAARVSRLVLLARKLQDICWSVYVQFAAQVAQTLFMPLALVVQGISARLHMVFGLWEQDLMAIYVLLLKWLPSLPACPDSLNGLTDAIAANLVHADELLSSTKPSKLELAGRESMTTKSAGERQAELDDALAMMQMQVDEEEIHKSKLTEQSDQQQFGTRGKKRSRQRVVDLYADDD